MDLEFLSSDVNFVVNQRTMSRQYK